MAESPRLQRIDEVAKQLGISRSTLYTVIRRGELGVVKVGRCTRVAVEDLDAYVRHLRVTPPAA